MGFQSQTGYSSLCVIHPTDEGFYCLLAVFCPERISKSVSERKPHFRPVISFACGGGGGGGTTHAAAFFLVALAAAASASRSHLPCMSHSIRHRKKLQLPSRNVFISAIYFFKSVIWKCFKGLMESLSPFCTRKTKLCVAVKVVWRRECAFTCRIWAVKE